jgi:hypothetical protein
VVCPEDEKEASKIADVEKKSRGKMADKHVYCRHTCGTHCSLMIMPLYRSTLIGTPQGQ